MGASPLPAERIEVATAEDMHALGRRLASMLRAGDLVVLSGPLGAGKTTLVQGIGQGLDVRGPVTSPTFVIARVHPALGGGPALVHVDAYRLGSVAEVDDLDLDASLDDCVTVVEWGEGLVEGLAADRLEVTITMSPAGEAGDSRMVGLTGIGERWANAAESACCALPVTREAI
ncbi:MAG TPA: tRNA (adenosine(37)-N6)-threonylcarbamoyltransferase complex ATPase subunit type 1 TsaE [Streptosporangiaceae bacterium]|nr:tRNA (adenosine(37)-N6)-threonylcarbamoyltransferase complex ATPase subunit type 1 TsaE [Streptosporangiaceae bacterium]